MCFTATIKLPLQEAPSWLSHIEITREGDEICIDIVKQNGLSYGHAQLSDVDFNTAVDLVLTRSPMEKTI